MITNMLAKVLIESDSMNTLKFCANRLSSPIPRSMMNNTISAGDAITKAIRKYRPNSPSNRPTALRSSVSPPGPIGHTAKLIISVPTSSVSPPAVTKVTCANRPSRLAESDWFAPLSGSTNCAVVAPDLVSIISPADAIAHRKLAKNSPITVPAAASRAINASHCAALRVLGSNVTGNDSATSPNAMISELRTIGGIICAENSGNITKAKPNRADPAPTSSACSVQGAASISESPMAAATLIPPCSGMC